MGDCIKSLRIPLRVLPSVNLFYLIMRIHMKIMREERISSNHGVSLNFNGQTNSKVLHQRVQDFPTITLGVGTVLNTKDAENAKKVEEKFIMSPAVVKAFWIKTAMTCSIYLV
ncbi:putative aldolase-type TIM barrel [Helianthus debilis subsp. tardiflorus]